MKSLFTSFFILFINVSSSYSAASLDTWPKEKFHQLPAASIAARPQYIEFTIDGQTFAIARTLKEDFHGFKKKDEKKTEAERTKFSAQFGLGHSIQIMGLHQRALENVPDEFKCYSFGLFSIFAIDGENAAFVGELNLCDAEISTDGSAEISIDIDPDARRKKIGFCAQQKAIAALIDPALNKKVMVIDYSRIRERDYGHVFSESVSCLTRLKSKVDFDNLPSLRINKTLGFCMWNFTVGCEISYVYPPIETAMTEGGLRYARMLLSDRPSERAESISVLTASLAAMK